MERLHKIEEALSIIWEEREKNLSGRALINDKILEAVKEEMLEDLAKDGYVVMDGSSVKFTKAGEERAKDIIRRQRLAERLLADVLEVGRREMTSTACEFEHIISNEVEESICTLLGHPKECPHGLPVPQGECCKKAKNHLVSIVVPLSKLAPAEAGKVLYILTHEHPQLHKLMSLGIVPGVRLSVHQIFPSFVIQVEETHLALETDIANNIYVKKIT